MRFRRLAVVFLFSATGGGLLSFGAEELQHASRLELLATLDGTGSVGATLDAIEKEAEDEPALCVELGRRFSSYDASPVRSALVDRFRDPAFVCRRHVMSVVRAIATDCDSCEIAGFLSKDELTRNHDEVGSLLRRGNESLVAILSALIGSYELQYYQSDLAELVLERAWRDDKWLTPGLYGRATPWGVLMGGALLGADNTKQRDPRVIMAFDSILRWCGRVRNSDYGFDRGEIEELEENITTALASSENSGR